MQLKSIFLCIIYVKWQNTWKMLWKKLYHREKNQFSFKDEIYHQHEIFKLCSLISFFLTKFYQDGLTKETISNKKSTSKQKLVSCNSDDSLLSPGPIWSLACRVLLKKQDLLYQVHFQVIWVLVKLPEGQVNNGPQN